MYSVYFFTPTLEVLISKQIFYSKDNKFKFLQSFEEIITKKESITLVQVKIDNSHVGSTRYIGAIHCPLCSTPIQVSHSSNQHLNEDSGQPWWNSSNYDRHLKLKHKRILFKEETDCECWYS